MYQLTTIHQGVVSERGDISLAESTLLSWEQYPPIHLSTYLLGSLIILAISPSLVFRLGI
jgi:hypothetical protein